MAGLPDIYLCRHGQTDWNAEGRLQGQRDVHLNAFGRVQAARNGQMLRDILGSRTADFGFLSSPLVRTVDTMRIIRGELGLDPSDFATDERLVELHFGDWQGSTLEEVEGRMAGSTAVRDADKWNFVPSGPGAESYEALLQRVRPVFEGLTRPSVIVAHGGIARVFLRLYAGWSENDAAYVSIPQDRILAARGGKVEWV